MQGVLAMRRDFHVSHSPAIFAKEIFVGDFVNVYYLNFVFYHCSLILENKLGLPVTTGTNYEKRSGYIFGALPGNIYGTLLQLISNIKGLFCD